MIIDKHDEAFSSYSKQKLCQSLQYFKKVRNRVYFCMQINTKFLKIGIIVSDGNQIRRLVIFLQYFKKTVFCFLITAFVFNCDLKHLDNLWGSSHICCYLFFVHSKMGAAFYIHICIADINFPQETF